MVTRVIDKFENGAAALGKSMFGFTWITRVRGSAVIVELTCRRLCASTVAGSPVLRLLAKLTVGFIVSPHDFAA
jgi:hypothetical protein